tara:strand:- start:214 stop:906 length:693 start_codon:yes stop_codon:yes gene_type:complete
MTSCIAIFKHYNTKEHYSDFVYGILQQPVSKIAKKFDIPSCYRYYAHPGGQGRITHEIVEIHQMNTNISIKLYYISEHEIGELSFPCNPMRKRMHRRNRRHRKVRETYLENWGNLKHPWHWFCEFHNNFYKIGKTSRFKRLYKCGYEWIPKQLCYNIDTQNYDNELNKLTNSVADLVRAGISINSLKNSKLKEYFGEPGIISIISNYLYCDYTIPGDSIYKIKYEVERLL